MKTYGSLSDLRGLLCDIDGTLYDSKPYMASQQRVLIQRLADELGRDYETVHEQVRDAQRRIAEHSGGIPSLGKTFLEFGIGMEKSVAWRRELLAPERYLAPDERLAETLSELSQHFRLVALTNNPSDVAARTLERLGVDGLFADTVALDDTFVSKPDYAPFRAGLAALGLTPARVASIGDRYDVDIAPALELGMAGVLVEGVKDVYLLPELLLGSG